MTISIYMRSGVPECQDAYLDSTAGEGIVYSRTHGAALGASPWSTTHDTLIVTILAPVLGVLIIAVHSLPLHYRPE
jgi:hypothetical protein